MFFSSQIFLICYFIRFIDDRPPFAFRKIKKSPGLSFASPSVLEKFFFYDGATVKFIDY